MNDQYRIEWMVDVNVLTFSIVQFSITCICTATVWRWTRLATLAAGHCWGVIRFARCNVNHFIFSRWYRQRCCCILKFSMSVRCLQLIKNWCEIFDIFVASRKTQKNSKYKTNDYETKHKHKHKKKKLNEDSWNCVLFPYHIGLHLRISWVWFEKWCDEIEFAILSITPNDWGASGCIMKREWNKFETPDDACVAECVYSRHNNKLGGDGKWKRKR